MPKPKYDWQGLKKEFIDSDFEDVKSFLSSKWMRWKVSNKRVNGWWKEKKEHNDKILEKALIRQQNKLAKQLEVPAELCLENIKKSIELCAVKLQQMEEKQNINTKDLTNIWTMNRIQNNMPTTYVKSENLNIDRIEWIHIIMNPKQE